MVGVVSATPMYIHATIHRILRLNFSHVQQETQMHPATMSVTHAISQNRPIYQTPLYLETRNIMIPEAISRLGAPVYDIVETYHMNDRILWPVEPRGIFVRARVLGNDMLAERVNIVTGRLPSEAAVPYGNGYIIEAIVSEAMLANSSLIRDELMFMFEPDAPNVTVYVKVVGTFTLADDAYLYWSMVDFDPMGTFIVANQAIREALIDTGYRSDYRIVASWHVLFDTNRLSINQIDNYIYVMEDYFNRFNVELRGGAVLFQENFSETLISHRYRTDSLGITLWILQVPMYVLLAFYIYMVSRQILIQDQTDISVLSSRGVSRLHIMGLYVLQGLITTVISLPAGLWLGMMFCRMLGASSGFLYMVQRAALPVEITPAALAYSGVAVFVSFLAMFIPVIGFSRVNIIAHNQQKRGKAIKKSFCHRFFLDVLCLGVSIYGLYTFNLQREVMSTTMQDAQSIDPLLLLSSSLFMIGAGLFALRIFPYLIKFVYVIGKKIWSPPMYSALLRVTRASSGEQFIMFFLVITMAIGIFNANTARTITTNNDHRINYTTGADFIFQELWINNLPQITPGELSELLYQGEYVHIPNHLVYQEPDFARFLDFDEVDVITRVQTHPVTVATRASAVEDVLFMAIETDTFGEAIWFRDDLLYIHINYFLNVLAKTPNGVLLSYNFKTLLGYSVGDSISIGYFYYAMHDPRWPFTFNSAQAVVVGFVEYWPGYLPVEVELLDTGETVFQDKFLAVTNLGYIQTMWGAFPYQVWMRTNTTNNRFFYDFAAEHEIEIAYYSDSFVNVIDSRSDPILQGTNGVLTMGFIVTLTICFVGFLIYWILSIRSRVLQFGIFRAMGMNMRDIFRLLAYEQLLITFTAIVIGTLVGLLASWLYIPLIQMSYTAARQILPLIITSEMRDYRNIFMVVGSMVVVCLVVLSIYVTRIKVHQALKLGED